MLTIAILLISTVPVTSFAAPTPIEPHDEGGTPEFAQSVSTKATLQEMNGNRRYVLTPVLVEAQEISPNSYQLTYEVGIPKEYLNDTNKKGALFDSFNPFVSTVSAGSDSHSGCDGTVSVCASLTLYFTQISNHGWYNYTTNRWTRYDGTVSMSDAKLEAGCNATWYSKPNKCNTYSSNNIGVPTSGSLYSYTPSFSGSSNELYINSTNGIWAYQFVKLTRGLSTWNFSFCVKQGGMFSCY